MNLNYSNIHTEQFFDIDIPQFQRIGSRPLSRKRTAAEGLLEQSTYELDNSHKACKDKFQTKTSSFLASVTDLAHYEQISNFLESRRMKDLSNPTEIRKAHDAEHPFLVAVQDTQPAHQDLPPPQVLYDNLLHDPEHRRRHPQPAISAANAVPWLRRAAALVAEVAAEVAAAGGGEQAAAIMAGTLGADGRLQLPLGASRPGRAAPPPRRGPFA